ncbi:uncharacterized protein [Palaemon carinicauda]
MFGQQPSIRPNAPVCAFYQKGQCKYGTQCWNLHPPNQGAAVGGMASTFGGNVFGAKTGTQADSKEFTEFMKQVSVEMSQWERNGQWLFSSFTPLKSHPLLAGFSDHSPEEMRVVAYEALKTNTSSAYQDQWNKLQQQYKQLRDALRSQTPDAYQAMKEVFYSKSSSDQQLQSPSQTGKSGSLFGKPAGTLFGGSPSIPAQPGAGLLGAKPQSSIFGGGGSLFGGNQTSSSNVFGDSAKKTLFGGPANLGAQSPSTFGAQPSASPFGGGGTSLFGSSGGSVFGGSKMQGSLFGGSSATNQTSGSIFGGGGNASTTTASIFGGGTSTNPVTSTTGSIFGGGGTANPAAAATGSIFGGNSANAAAPATGNTFGGSNNVATSTSGSVFGGGQNQTSSIFGNNNQTTTPTFGWASTPTTTSSVFGTSNTTSNVFGSSNANTTSGSVFGTNPSLFGGSQNQNQPSTPLFGNSAPGTSSIFGGNPATSEAPAQNAPVFGLNVNASSPFSGSGTTASTSGGTGLFGGGATSGLQSGGSIFASSSNSSGSPGLFGKQPDSQPSPQVNTGGQTLGGGKLPGNVKAEWFTPLDQLDPADKGQFEAEAFTSIPLCPPPVELCF